MPNLEFYLDTFKITDTRSHHDDTLIAGIGVYVNGKEFGPNVQSMGDFNNGTHSFSKHKLQPVTGVPVNPTDSVVVVIEIYNNGDHHSPNENLLRGEIGTAAQKLFSATIPAVKLGDDQSHPTGADANSKLSAYPVDFPNADGGETTQPVLENVLTGGLYSLIKSAFKDCDGPVAVAGYVFKGATIIDAINAAADKTFHQSDTFNAKKEGWGTPCNSSGSNYIVNWGVKGS